MRPTTDVAPVLVAIAAAVAAGCSGSSDASSSLLVRREIDGHTRMIQVPVAGGSERDIFAGTPGDIRSALVVDRGRAVLAIVPSASGRELWRAEVGGKAPVRVWEKTPGGWLDSANGAGTVVSLGNGSLLLLDGAPRVEDLHAPRGNHHRGGDVSDNGRRVLISLGPECTASTKPWDCRLEVWGFDRDAADKGWRLLAGGATSTYNARFIPGSDGRELVFHRVQADPACPGPWACRKEEIVRIGFDGRGERAVRAQAWTPRFSADGRSVAVATMPDHRLLVGPLDGELAEIADDAMFAIAWSHDNGWVAYHTFNGGSGGRHGTGIVRRDGRDHRVLDGQAIGWIAGALGGTPVSELPDAAPPIASGAARPVSASFGGGAIELVSVARPSTVPAHAKFEMVLRYRVVRTPDTRWNVLVHFDGQLRFQGDHEPPRGSRAWNPGEEIEDRFVVTAGPAGTYSVFVGFFTGGAGTWKNVPVERANADEAGRVRVGTLRVE